MGKILNTDNLIGQHLQPDHTVVFDARTSAAVSETIVELTPEHAKQVAATALRDTRNFGMLEGTFVEDVQGGLPTVVARVDCTLSDGNIQSYETDERPAGLGVVEKMSASLGVPDSQNPSRLALAHFEQTFGKLPVSLIELHSPPNDDSLVLEQRTLYPGTVLHSIDAPVLVRANPKTVLSSIGGPDRLENLQQLSVSTVATEGLKRYRIVSGDAVRFDPSHLPSRDFPFVYKPMQGSKAEGLGVYTPKGYDRRYAEMGDRTSYNTAINNMMEATYDHIIEPFHPGLAVTAAGLAANAILRVYVALICDADSEKYSAKVLGGAYVARPGLIVHGRSDAVAGMVLAPDPAYAYAERVIL